MYKRKYIYMYKYILSLCKKKRIVMNNSQGTLHSGARRGAQEDIEFTYSYIPDWE